MLLVPAFQMGKFICVSGIKYILILAICLDETGVIANSAYSSRSIRYFIALFPSMDHNYPVFSQFMTPFDTFSGIVQRVICSYAKPLPPQSGRQTENCRRVTKILEKKTSRFLH